MVPVVVEVALINGQMPLQHHVLLLQGVHTLRLLEELDLSLVLLAGDLLELQAHEVELLLQEVDLAMLPVNQLLLARQIDLHRALLLLHERKRQHVLMLEFASQWVIQARGRRRGKLRLRRDLVKLTAFLPRHGHFVQVQTWGDRKSVV